jgi:hypothetical protein
MMKNPSPTPPEESGQLSILIPAITVIPYCELKRKSDKALVLFARDMAEYMQSEKPGVWAIAKVNYQAIEEILNQREKARKVEQLSFVA